MIAGPLQCQAEIIKPGKALLLLLRSETADHEVAIQGVGGETSMMGQTPGFTYRCFMGIKTLPIHQPCQQKVIIN
jgi:hypothetical protein